MACMPTPSALATALRDARVAQGRSLADVGAACGVSHSAVSRWETGARVPSLPTLRRLADALGLPRHQVIALASEG